MWTRLANFVIRYRLLLVIVLGVVTLFMGYFASKVEISYDYAKVVPATNPEMIYFEEFKQTFGQDDNLMALGIKDSAIYKVENFRRLLFLTQELTRLEAVAGVVSLAQLPLILKDTANTTFKPVNVWANGVPDDQQTFDSLLALTAGQKLFAEQLINPENGATAVLITVNREVFDSDRREFLMQDVLDACHAFEQHTGIKLHYAGLPFIRSVMTGKVKDELSLFLGLSVLITALILLAFYRSWDAVVFPLIVIAVVVVWSLGTLVLFGFKMTFLSGLIPPIIVVIGIPNSVYLLNRYHREFKKHGNRAKSIYGMVRKIGLATLITNTTTAIGFLVLVSTDIVILREFGIVAGINILATFLVSIILIPAVFSWLPPPNPKRLKHLKFPIINGVLYYLDLAVHRHKYTVFAVTGIIVAVAFFGISKLQSVSYMVDDIPEDSDVKRDLAFFESNFGGIMPLEIVVDTGKPRGARSLTNLRKVEKFQDFLAAQEPIATPLSIVNLVKASKQAFYNANPERYRLPTNFERTFVLRYLQNGSDSLGALQDAFVDSTGRYLRVSTKVADIGSIKMDSMVTQVIEPAIEEYLGKSNLEGKVTGTSLIFVMGNRFMIENLFNSLLLAFLIIALIMGFLFRNFRIILISIVPNVIPLIITAGIMGYFGIPLKPSTALIFSIAFGISVDDSIHFLAKYRQELFANKFFVPIAVSRSIKETGASMVYTSIILFAGFVIFAGSEFGGTVALGILTSLTLLIAMLTNLIVLPSLLMAFDSGKRNSERRPPIEQYSEDFYFEDEDEEINLDRIEVE